MGIGWPADKWGSTAPFPHAPHGASRSATLILDPQSLWIHPRIWPNAQRGYLFLVPAVERVGGHLFGNTWRYDGFLLEEYSLPTDMLAASAKERAYAHSILQRLHGDAYTPDFEEDRLTPLGGLAGLGGASIPDLLNPRRAIRLGEPPSRAEGYWFTDVQWDEAKAYLHATNLENRPRIEMATEVSRWLSDEIAAGSIRAQLFRVDGRDLREGLTTEWPCLDLDRRRRRLRNCRMMPGDPASENGSHLIFVKDADLAAALDRRDRFSHSSRSADNGEQPQQTVSACPAHAAAPQALAKSPDTNPATPAQPAQQRSEVMKSDHDPQKAPSRTKRRGAENFGPKDKSFIELMRGLVEVEGYSPNRASQIIIAEHRANIAGTGNDDSKARRIREGYRRDRSERGLGEIGE
jgi:hypothetical protein